MWHEVNLFSSLNDHKLIVGWGKMPNVQVKASKLTPSNPSVSCSVASVSVFTSACLPLMWWEPDQLSGGASALSWSHIWKHWANVIGKIVGIA